MATKEWLGDGSANLFNVAGNWTPSGVPGAGDVALFNDKANNRDCNFNVTTGSSLTIGEIIVESTYGGIVLLQTVPVTKGIFLGKASGIKQDTVSSIDFRQGGSGSEYGSYKSFANRFLMIDDVGTWGTGGVTLNMYGGSVVTKFDDGDHATTVLKTGSFAPNYVAPTGTSGKTTFTAFTADNGITFQPTGNLVDNDRLKHFDFGTFTYSDDLFNAGAATCEFKATSSGIYLPITGATGYGQNPSGNPSDFVSYMRKVILNADTAGHKILMRDNSYVSLEELEIGDGVMFKGPMSLNAQGSDIRLVNAPKIRGSWSFSQISQGVYRSPRHASGPMPKIQGSLEITNKLTVGGLIDPTGLVIDEKGSVAATGHTTVGGKGLLWVKTGSPNELYFTNEDGDDVQITSGSSIAGGGGGSGTVTSIATTAPITGGTITTTGTIGISAATTSAAGSMSGADKTKLDGIATSATAYADADAIAAVEGTSSLDLTGDLTMDTSKKIIMDEKTYAAASASSGTIELTAEKTGSNPPLLTLRTPTGYLRMGSQNSSFCHFYTDRDYFYFNKNIQMDGGSFYAYNDDFQIKTDDSGSGQPTRIYIDAGVDECRVGIGNGFTSSSLPATELEVAGTIRQSNATSAVLIADSNGDLTAASNLQDAVYVQSGQGGSEPFNIVAPGAPTNWAGTPPATIEEAINRLAAQVVVLGGPIP